MHLLRRQLPKIFLLTLISAIIPALLVAQTSPEEFLGFKVGADRKLADYSQIKGYFEQLAQESPRLELLNIGKSTLGKTMIMAVITTEDNMAELGRYKEITKKLKNAHTLPPEAAAKLAQEGKVILLITCNIHATEIASSQMSMELAYKLVSGNTPFDADKMLKEVIVLLVPTTNPDGEQMVTEWYRKYVGTEYEGGRMPWLYHHYAGHDNNRDWFMFNLPETRAVSKVLYHEWFPQIHIDEHQMGSTGARLFIPPFMDPPVPNVQPLLWRGVNLCGVNMAYDLEKEGYTGVVHGRSFTGWWIGACDDTSWLHNVIGLLSEMASVNVATPIYIEPNEIPKSYYEKRMNFPNPWPGGWWRLRDLVDYELTLSFSLIKTAYLHKKDLLHNFYLMNKNAIEGKGFDGPFAFVIPKDQHDYLTALHMLNILMMGGVEIHQAEEDFIAGQKFYHAGSFVVLMTQPYRPYAQALLEKQTYPDMRQYEGGPPIPPYDNAGWTLPLQMGITCHKIDKPFKAKLKKIDELTYPETDVASENSAYFVLDSALNSSYGMVFALLKEKTEVHRALQQIKTDEYNVPAGSFIIKNDSKVQKILSELIRKWHITPHQLESIDGIKAVQIKNPRIGIYQSYMSNMDEGWTRCVLDDFSIPFITLHNKDIKESKKEGLKSKIDVLIFASEMPELIINGKLPPGHRWARYFTPLPPEYQGGIGKEGVEAIKTFVEKGGILVTLNEACNFAFKEFNVPVRNTLEKVSRSKFFCPTSLLRIKVDQNTPIGFGMGEETAAMFSNSLAFDTWIPSGTVDRKVVAHFPVDNILLSGWLLGEEHLARKAAVVDVKYKKGRIILIGIRCQNRAQTHGTYKFLFNAMLYPGVE
jgi:hypothetical protein